MKIVTYVRVSSDKQGRSGLGLEAQKEAIRIFAATHAAHTVASFMEVETGRDNERPELAQALKTARIHGATLVIAKLDRLSRNAEFLLRLQSGSVPFICCDMPDANALTVGIMAVIAQAESKAIADRTRAAMSAAKAAGRTFGNPNGADAIRRAAKGNAASCEAQKITALTRARDLADVLSDVEAAGHKTLQAIASELNARGIQTARGGAWHASTVANLRARLAA